MHKWLRYKDILAHPTSVVSLTQVMLDFGGSGIVTFDALTRGIRECFVQSAATLARDSAEVVDALSRASRALMQVRPEQPQACTHVRPSAWHPA